MIVSVPPSATIEGIAEDVLALARSGSSLDITGDVIDIAGGSAMKLEMNGTALARSSLLSDGAIVTVSHGDHHLEGIARKEQVISFETVLEGSGPVVSLVRRGESGKKEIFCGEISAKQAAVFTIVAPKNAVVRRTAIAKAGQKLAALTFDDGPGKFTQGVLDALAAKRVPATFFVLGSSAAANKNMIQRIKAAGHEVENHTWSHPVLTRLTSEQIRSEISRTSSVIGGSRFLRPPYGSYNTAVTAEADSLGQKLVLWTVDTLDWKYPDVDSILDRVKAQTEPGAIILMHDGGNNRSQTVAAIPRVIDWLFTNGYSLTTVGNLL